MCGINGFLDPAVSADAGMKMILDMANEISHRGPDNTSFYQKNECFFAHNRLSIIDLSSDGNQPMQNENLIIVFNGEIYNYKEIRSDLKKRGHLFKTNSDTEVILVSYKQWGEDCVNYFIGMWAFVIYNEATRKLFCSRDRFGIKPFYYIHSGNAFYFSSEIKALKKSKKFKNDLNEIQIKKAVQLGWYFDEDKTLFSNIFILEPASNLFFENGKILKKQYWSIPNIKSPEQNKHVIIEQFKDQLCESLNLHVRSDVPIGATLSGGLDSSSIVSGIINQKILECLETFTIYYDDFGDIDERPFANAVIEKYKNNIHAHFLKPEESEVASHFQKITFHNDFPLLGSSSISQYFIMKEISKFGVKVILSGQGADDYLGGYMHTYYRLYAQLLSEFKFKDLFSEIKHHIDYQNLTPKAIFKIGVKSLASLFFNESKLSEVEYKHGLLNLFHNKSINLDHAFQNHNRFDQIHEAMIKFSSLPNLLHYEDRNSMAFSIESRVPFLDHRLVEFAFSLPLEYKIYQGYTKWILRQSMKNILPENIFYRKDKIGFVTPGEVKWLRNDLRFLLTSDFKDIPNLDTKKTKEIKAQFLKGDNKNAKIIWRLATVQNWINNQ